MRSQLRVLDADLDDVFDRLKRLAARKGMRQLRDDQAAKAANGGMLPGETGQQWKERMRLARAGGKKLELEGE